MAVILRSFPVTVNRSERHFLETPPACHVGIMSACWLEARGADCLDWMGLFYQTRLLVETMFKDFCYLLAGSQQLYPTRHTLGNSTAKVSHKCQPFRKTFCGNTTCLPFWYHVRLLAMCAHGGKTGRGGGGTGIVFSQLLCRLSGIYSNGIMSRTKNEHHLFCFILLITSVYGLGVLDRF